MTRQRRAKLAVRAALLLSILGWMIVTAMPAIAHAELRSTTPGNGEHLDRAPAEVRLQFSKPVTPVRDEIRVLDAEGRRITEVSASIAADQPDTIRLPLPAVGDGVYTVAWRVVSADSHPIRGAFAFSVGNASPAPVAVPPPPDASHEAVHTTFWIIRWLGYGSIALLVGGVVFLLACWPAGRADPRTQRLVRAGWAAALATTVGGLLLQGPYTTGGSLAGTLDPTLLGDILRTGYGMAVVIRLLLLAVIGIILPRLAHTGDRLLGWPKLVGLASLGFGLLATWSFAGHARAGDQVPLTVTADLLHLAAMCVWVGGLAMLITCALAGGRDLGEVTRVLPRFSRIALGSVAVLAVTGTYQGWRELRSVAALTTTGYGQLLALKVVGFTLLLGLGAASRSAAQSRYVLPLARAFDDTTTGAAPPPIGDGGRVVTNTTGLLMRRLGGGPLGYRPRLGRRRRHLPVGASSVTTIADLAREGRHPRREDRPSYPIPGQSARRG